MSKLMLLYHLIWMSTVLLLILSFSCSAGKTCEKSDFKYAYTECKNNARWRVQVPNATCTAESVEFPKPGQKCDVTCTSGKYLDVKKDACIECPAGTYSLGSGVRFDMWKSLPAEFTASSDRLGASGAAAASCAAAKWKPLGNYLAGQSAPDCQLSLTYTVNLVTNGEVVFYYRYRSDLAFFAFEVQNGLCESVGREDNSSPLLEETNRNEIGTHRVPLKMGRNVLRWLVLPVADPPSSSSSSSSSSSAAAAAATDYLIALHSVQVSGIPYVYSCQTCHPGFTSSPGQAKCTKCGRDSYSTGGEACRACPAGQFAPAGSASCSPRPACRPVDYELIYSSCSAATHYQMAASYAWVQPHICSGGVDLPANPPADEQAAKPCRSYCNPGMRPVSSSKKTDAAPQLACEACPEGQFSADNSGECRPCPSKTQVVHAYSATNWFVVPPMMNLSCAVLLEDTVAPCAESGWHLMGDRVQTAASGLAHSRVLTLDLPGFHELPDAAAAAAGDSSGEVGALTIDFEMSCNSDCRLYLLKYELSRHVEVKSWSGKRPRKTFKYILRRTDRHKFYLIFEPAPSVGADSHAAEAGADWIGNRLIVYSVQATNALKSGGVGCQACPLGIKGNKCIPCPAGKYYHAKNATCYDCPPGTVVAKQPAEGVDSCAPCSAGLRARGGVVCDIDAKPERPTAKGSREFDFTSLVEGAYWLVEGGKQFTGRGTQYMHLYNVSLSSKAKARCVSNSTGVADALTVESFACRTTVVPNLRNASLTLAALPTSFGDRLVNATFGNRSAAVNAMMRDSGWSVDGPEAADDTHVFFETDYTTQVCQQHRVTLVTLRCDPKAARPQLALPPKCPDGTCDGCNFHLMLTAKQACQLCRKQDYERVNGECVLGKQIVHLFPPKRCYQPKGKPTKTTTMIDCPLVNKPVAIAMIVILGIGAISLGVACHCYRKNRSLQYKYMQLVESKEGELPGVESCAVHEGEGEDEDDDYDDAEVSVRRGGGRGGAGGAVLSKLRRSILPSGHNKRGAGGGGSRRSGNVEHLNLTEQMDDLSL